MIAPAVDGSGWLGRDLTDESAWIVEFDRETNERLAERAVMVASGAKVVADPANAPGVQAAVASMTDALLVGRGFTLLRGLPVDDLDDAGRAALCTIIGSLLGIPIRQNADGDELIRVRDEGKDFSQQGVRSYETAAPLPYHSDSSDVVGLLCVRAAQEGGASTIISSVAVHDAMVEARPDLAELLHQPWPTASIVKGTVEQQPICATNDSGQVFTRYGRMYVERAHEYDSSVGPLTEQLLAGGVFVAVGIRADDPLTVLGSVLWIASCGIWMLPLLRRDPDRSSDAPLPMRSRLGRGSHLSSHGATRRLR